MNKKNISLLLIGILIGSSITTIYLGHELDNLYIEVQTLEHDLQKAEERAKQLEEDIQKKEEQQGAPAVQLVKDVDIIIDYQDDEFTSLYIQEYCEEITKKLLGQEVQSLEPELIFQILDQRIVKLEEKEYRLYVKSLIIAEKTSFHIEPVLLEEDDED
ncbi:hypothetical protein [Natranaerofaba carboxydovora]|uniref:hypothetical protein n=1 Tax=Natranaerofaba carboxydovora TaxID=2742683 RepID=UPI001F1350A2|nr:hypothetical protein [Natranaerofaba carboxydovora]UMZ74496.1 hypothetical protein ACONDI_02088 [Natranaerofaba carboxydovora]